MAKGFSIDDVLGDQSKVTRPAGSRMDIVMLRAAGGGNLNEF